MTVSYKTLESIFNHVVLPPRLPGQQDGWIEEVDGELLSRLQEAVKTVKSFSKDEDSFVWEAILKSLQTCGLVENDRYINETALLQALDNLEPRQSIILRVQEQNAGLLIRHTGDNVIFETFEASPVSEEALEAQGALQWDFPGNAASLSRFDFEDQSFKKKHRFVPRKGVIITESRDTSDPALITTFLTTLLEVNGARITTPRLRKRIKDDVCWNDAELPWRRTPFWLVLRVSVQRLLYLEFEGEKGRAQYKFMMCCFLSQLLKTSINVLNVNQSCLLRAKLCRRLAKLENERTAANPTVLPIYSALFDTVGVYCLIAIDIATSSIEEQWVKFKTECQRRIPKLPRKAKGDDLSLALSNSNAYLQNALEQTHTHANRQSTFNPASLNLDSSKIKNEFLDSMTKKYFDLEELEMEIETATSMVENYQHDCDTKCRDTASKICDYLDAVGDAYDDNTEQKSISILNAFDLWVRMDKFATSVFPLLYEYHPCFDPEILDVLLLPRLYDLERLQYIQLYIDSRCSRAGQRMNIFAGPEKGCFADRYFQSTKSKDLGRLQDLQEEIEKASAKAKKSKKKQLSEVNRDYEFHVTEGMRQTTCTQRRHADGNHDIRGCTYCWHFRCSRRLRDDIHEDFLPGQDSSSKIIQKRAITFELDPPAAFLAYRDATWQIMNYFCFKEKLESKRKPEELLGSYSQLKGYNKNDKDLTLASKTKSFLGTHYKFKNLPAAETKVLLPLGLDFCYYDSRRRFWVDTIPVYLTVAHNFDLALPKELSFSKLYSTPDFAANSNGPTSYETIASISDCPTGLTVHEYIAHQNLVAGRSRRWLSILIELASSNVNFSLQDTAVLFNHLALQAGPGLGGNRLRDVHVVFKDSNFCKTLLSLIEKHTDAISANWREISYMEILLTLTIRLHTLGSFKITKHAFGHILKIRRLTLDWIRQIRHETRNTNEGDAAERKARYGFMASLLCRRTFSYQAYTDEYMDEPSLRDFVIATLAMQENLVVDLARFSISTRNSLIRDIKMTFRMKDKIRNLTKRYLSSIESAIETIWPISDSERQYSGWNIGHSDDWWISSMISETAYTARQYVHYHLLDGHLLVDGKPLGKLPSDDQNSSILKEIFGNQRLVAFPSNLHGMSYVLSIQKFGYSIHLGYRGNNLVIQAKKKDIFEFIPRGVFCREFSFDLPSSLIYDYVHWLNLRTKNIEIRRKNNIWSNASYGTWIINMETRRATRRESSLVDPRSKVFGSIAQIFRHFAEPHMLIVCQPKGNLYVELKNMDLHFVVNREGLLECSQLGSLVDPNQDAGTLYGLQSMIVLRDIENPAQRSVLTTIGELKCARHGMHVNIIKENEGGYARYMIDSVLGRLHCPPEPLLVYTKAQLHAFTSFVVPDPLTGRTGTEEALRGLKSGSCQPWNPLSSSGAYILQTIANLTPGRQYYPKDMKRQQKVIWDEKLTTTIQHDAYECVVQSIMEKSCRLRLFQEGLIGPKDNKIEVRTIPHLRDRAHWRRSIYERPGVLSPPFRSPPDRKYVSRGEPARSARTSNAREILKIISDQPTEIHTVRYLKCVLEKWKVIGGYTHDFVPYGISEYLEVNVAEEWGGLVNLCRKYKPEDAYDLMFRLGLVAFNDDVDMTVLRTIVAFFLLEDLKALEYPKIASISGSTLDKEITHQMLVDTLRSLCFEFEESSVVRKAYSPRGSRNPNSRKKHEKLCQETCELGANLLMKQWPTREPTVEEPDPFTFDNSVAEIVLTPLFKIAYDAWVFMNHIKEIQDILDVRYTNKSIVCTEPSQKKGERFRSVNGGNTIVPRLGLKLLCNKPETIESLLPRNPLISITEQTNQLVKNKLVQRQKGLTIGGKTDSTAEISELEAINNRLIHSDCPVRSTYGHDLNQSIVALKEVNETVASKPVTVINFDIELVKAHSSLYEYHCRILNAFSSGDSRHHWLLKAGLWPCTAAGSLLELLRSSSRMVLESGIKGLLIDYGKAIVKLQHLLRMRDALLKGDAEKFKQERSSLGHINWDPSVYPDWLLLEIDTNMQIREDQVTVALEMISPTSGANSVLQMNMGQGKTSVIMPMVACILADRNMLARLLVPKALLSQTAQILQSRLGGLLGREITHVPFSRRTPTTPQHIQAYCSLHEEMLQSSGIMLAIPEHVLSFKLCGLQRLSDLRTSEASQMVAVQKWMDHVCRDILDECDFTLATNTQLIYPSGAQLPIDGHPHRWKVGEVVLGLVSHHLRDLAKEFPKSLDIIERKISEFPVAYFLRSDVENALKKRLVDDICAGQTSILPMRDCTTQERQAVRAFISLEVVKKSILGLISRLFPDTPHFRKNVYLLRGLIVHGILLKCLKKRWNVQYGLHPNRNPVAVPFHAKGVPSEQAEWGHPDVAILFTCLAFYYQGLTIAQLRQSLQIVLKSDDPSTEYDKWTQASTTLPDSLRYWNIVNVDYDGQVSEIWRHLRFATVVINHYLNHFVFPAHARQFAIKLQASGWDVPLFSLDDSSTPTVGQRQAGITTGFSGTNDNRRLLPLTIEQRDLRDLSHTNAEVLTYLLQMRNRGYKLAADKVGRRFTEGELLVHLNITDTRILIDAGAFVLEKDNQTLVKEWLQKAARRPAAIYFGPDNKPWVQYRFGNTIPLLATPFADDLSDCLVYLDEAHTRGTDLKLPADAKAALTLGLNQTKDHTVQAAMRMRKLGTTQSITFIAPPEVHQSILDVCSKRSFDHLDSSHVITWLLDQTCTSNQELQPLYFAQGKNFCQRRQAAETYCEFLDNSDHRNAYMEVLRLQERQDLEELYSLEQTSQRTNINPVDLTGKLVGFEKTLQHRQHWSYGSIRGSVLEEIEQEREVAFEVEEERESQRPQRLPAFKFPGLSNAICNFITTSILNCEDGECGFIKASDMLDRTQLGKKYGVQTTSLLPHLYVSDEFVKTVKTKDTKLLDNYTRSVNWVLWSTISYTALVIIPEEAELLIPRLRTIEKPHVHLLLYAAPVTRKMLHFNKLNFYAIPSLSSGWTAPSWLPFELGILSGRLYFNFGDYESIIHDLRCDVDSKKYLSLSDSAEHDDYEVDASKTTLAFLMEWLSIRRQGQDITHSPMGYLCQGWTLRAEHPFFARRQQNDGDGPINNNNIGYSFQFSGNTADEDNYQFSKSEAEEENKIIDVEADIEEGGVVH